MSFRTVLDIRTYASQLLANGSQPSRKEEKDYILLSPLRYEVGYLGSGEIIEIPTGFITDFASVPRIFWTIIAPGGSHAAASVLHDWLYRSPEMHERYTRREADALFHEAMLASDTPRLRGWVMWLAVRSPGGAITYRRNKRKALTTYKV